MQQKDDVLYVDKLCPQKRVLRHFINRALWLRKSKIVFTDTTITVRSLTQKREHPYSRRVTGNSVAAPVRKSTLDVYNTLPGLKQAQKSFYPFTVLDLARDAVKPHVYMLLIQFRGRVLGFCSWDMLKKQFVAEPSSLTYYGTTLIELCNKYEFSLPSRKLKTLKKCALNVR